MGSVFLLWHVRGIEGVEDELLIGVYTTEDEANGAIGPLKGCKGFVDDPTGFQIHRYPLNQDSWTEGFVIVE
jgi:homoserine kinase type II